MKTYVTAGVLLALAGCHKSAGGHLDAGAASSGDMTAAAAPDMTVLEYSDLPAAPQVDTGLPTDIATQFGTGGAGDGGAGGPCLVEPSMGALIPNNWTPLYFEWRDTSGATVFELRLHVANQKNDLVVYTSNSKYSVPAALWTALSQHSTNLDIEVSIRSGTLSGSTLSGPPALGTSGAVKIAPVGAPGNIVYWTTSTGTALKGYTIGAPTVSTVITPTAMGDGTMCVGCHTSAPDGAFAFLSRSNASGPYSVDVRSVDGKSTKAGASVVTDNAFTNLARTNQTLPTLSAAHYSATDSVVITTLSSSDTLGKTELVWTDLLATTGGTGIIARTGDTKQAAEPNFSHDGTKIVYVSSDAVGDGRTSTAETDIWTVPYASHAGGAATPLAGASTAGIHEYYPVFSPDDQLIAYNTSPMNADTYNEPKAEVYVIPAAGGTGSRLVANDPPACLGVTSPGVTNSWPRWSPQIQTGADGTKYLWLVFSSTRRGGSPQLYVTAIVQSGTTTTTYPALYIDAQPPTEANHTPAWDVFKLAPIN